jgi:DNA (cytosine-5)-methyltransferase 1
MVFKVASFFSGAGGLDLGFHKAGFDIVWANEFDKKVTPTLRKNFPHTVVDDRSITLVEPSDVPEVDGIIGGPPCQSWSEAGAGRGLDDARGQVFLDYIELIKAKKPKFFLAENVSGMLSKTHEKAFNFLISEMESLGYRFDFKLLNAADYGVPEDRLRVIFVGYQKDLGIDFEFPEPLAEKITLKDAIWDLRKNAMPAAPGNRTNGTKTKFLNHEYMTGGFSTIYLSRNRVRGWDEQSFTIQAGARHAPLHPQAPKMVKIAPNEQIFAPGSESLYRRLTVREAARIQTFPDDFEFVYENVADGYKMVGNAVAVNFAKAIAEKIHSDLVNSGAKPK